MRPVAATGRPHRGSRRRILATSERGLVEGELRLAFITRAVVEGQRGSFSTNSGVAFSTSAAVDEPGSSVS